MQMTLISEQDSYDPDVNSGTLYQMAKGLESLDHLQLNLMHISLIDKLLPPLDEFKLRCKQFWLRYVRGFDYEPMIYDQRAKFLGSLLNKRLKNLKTDVIFTAISPITAASLETNIPIVFWTDFVFDAILGFYPEHRYHHPDIAWEAHFITKNALMNSKLLIFSSGWVARAAQELYGISKNKIKVVPFGANLDISHDYDDVKNMIRARSRDCIKLLFVGNFWYRKGGDIVLRITKALHEAGHKVELTVVGADDAGEKFPPYVKRIPFISKYSKAGVEKLKQLYAESHFFVMPSRAEAFGIVLCEANAFGVPCITTHVGGIPEVIKDGINGMAFSLENTIQEFCDYITNLFHHYDQYESLALSSYNEYVTRLNWKTSCKRVENLIREII